MFLAIYYYLNHVYRKIFFDLFKIQNGNMAIENLEKHMILVLLFLKQHFGYI